MLISKHTIGCKRWFCKEVQRVLSTVRAQPRLWGRVFENAWATTAKPWSGSGPQLDWGLFMIHLQACSSQQDIAGSEPPAITLSVVQIFLHVCVSGSLTHSFLSFLFVCFLSLSDMTKTKRAFLFYAIHFSYIQKSSKIFIFYNCQSWISKSRSPSGINADFV